MNGKRKNSKYFSCQRGGVVRRETIKKTKHDKSLRICSWTLLAETISSRSFCFTFYLSDKTIEIVYLSLKDSVTNKIEIEFIRFFPRVVFIRTAFFLMG